MILGLLFSYYPLFLSLVHMTRAVGEVLALQTTVFHFCFQCPFGSQKTKTGTGGGGYSGA
jgi:hypothetical protein